jgi:hypothetical protein
MTRRKKTVLILLSIFPGLPLLLIAAALAIRGCDEPPPYDEDLKVKRLQIPDDQNAFTYYQRAIGKLQSPGEVPLPTQGQGQGQEKAEDEPKTELELYQRIRWGERWDGPLVDKVIKQNAAALDLWEEGLALAPMQVPEVKCMDDVSSCQLGFLRLSELVSFRARAAAMRGDYEAAFQDCVKLIRFGQQIEGAKGSLTTYLIGATIKISGCELMRKEASGCTLAPERLRRYAADVGKCPADAEGLADAARGEYTFLVDFLQGLKSGRYDPAFVVCTTTVSAFPFKPSASDRVVGQVSRMASFKVQATRRGCAEACRSVVADAPRHFKDVVPVAPDLADSGPVRELFSGNLLGRRFLRGTVPGMKTLAQHKCQENVAVAATRILLALKAYKLEKGKLPATLAELVPDYLDSVPLDDYDGQPMRYNAAKKVVYSVGKDLKDDGGSGTRAEHVARKRKEAEAAGEKWTDELQKDAEQEFNEWHQPDACFEIKF